MSNSFFDWGASLTRFIRLDTARAEDVNDAFDAVSTGLDEVEVLTSSALKLPTGEVSPALPTVDQRKGKFLIFNSATGAAEATISYESINAVATNFSTLEAIEDGLTDINYVAAHLDDVTTVADSVDAAATSASNAAAASSSSYNSSVTANTFASMAESFALSAVLSPGTSATSTTSIITGTGDKSFVIQTGKSLVVGMKVIIASTADPAGVFMSGTITTYNPGTGAITVDVDVAEGEGTFSAWTISLTGGPQAVSHVSNMINGII